MVTSTGFVFTGYECIQGYQYGFCIFRIWVYPWLPVWVLYLQDMSVSRVTSMSFVFTGYECIQGYQYEFCIYRIWVYPGLPVWVLYLQDMSVSRVTSMSFVFTGYECIQGYQYGFAQVDQVGEIHYKCYPVCKVTEPDQTGSHRSTYHSTCPDQMVCSR